MKTFDIINKIQWLLAAASIMATKAKTRTNMMAKNPNSTKKISKQGEIKKDHYVHNPMAMNHVIHQILPLFPTKALF